jgi:hypothetical protein
MPTRSPRRGRRSRSSRHSANSQPARRARCCSHRSPQQRLASRFCFLYRVGVPGARCRAIVARQLASRARRRRVQGENTVRDADLDTQSKVLDAFSGPLAAATSTRSSPSSTPTSRCGRTSGPCPRADRGRSAGRRRSPARRSPSHGLAWSSGRRSSTAPSEPSQPSTESRSVGGITGKGRKIVEIDILADPERLRPPPSGHPRRLTLADGEGPRPALTGRRRQRAAGVAPALARAR